MDSVYGYKKWRNGFFIIKIGNYPEMSYLFYSAREAEKKYREAFDLKYKRITWLNV